MDSLGLGLDDMRSPLGPANRAVLDLWMSNIQDDRKLSFVSKQQFAEMLQNEDGDQDDVPKSWMNAHGRWHDLCKFTQNQCLDQLITGLSWRS